MAPYAGIVASVAAEQGDLASPGIALLTLYDPTDLRVVAAIPGELRAQLASRSDGSIIEIPDARWRPATIEATHDATPANRRSGHPHARRCAYRCRRLRLRAWHLRTCPASADLATRPARLAIRPSVPWCAGPGSTPSTSSTPPAAPQLRQVRLGREMGDDVEVLAGLRPGDRIAARSAPPRGNDDGRHLQAPLGVAGPHRPHFQSARITPLLALVALLLGLFAVLVTPREEEPQINVTMANVLIPFPGARPARSSRWSRRPPSRCSAQMAGLEHVMSVSRPGLAVITVQFKVGVPRTEALVRLYDTIFATRTGCRAASACCEPIVKPKGIDDVPILTLALFSRRTRQRRLRSRTRRARDRGRAEARPGHARSRRPSAARAAPSTSCSTRRA